MKGDREMEAPSGVLVGSCIVDHHRMRRNLSLPRIRPCNNHTTIQMWRWRLMSIILRADVYEGIPRNIVDPVKTGGRGCLRNKECIPLAPPHDARSQRRDSWGVSEFHLRHNGSHITQTTSDNLSLLSTFDSCQPI